MASSTPQRRPSRRAIAPENVPLAHESRLLFFVFEHLFASSAGFVFLGALLFSVATFSFAQEFSAPVSAVVLPLESYCPACIPAPHPLVRWWNAMDTTTKMMVASGGALAGLLIPLGAAMAIKEFRHSRGRPFVHA